MATTMPRKTTTRADQGPSLFEPDWLESLDLLLDRDSGIFYLFYDDNQRLYRSTEIPAWLGKPYPLMRNVRNTEQIGRLVRQFYDGQMRLSGVDGSPVKVIFEPEASLDEGAPD